MTGSLGREFLFILGAFVLAALLIPPRFLKPFRSVRFNIVLFVVIAFVSAIGTFFPQNIPFEEAQARYGIWWAAILDRMKVFNLYHSGWFSALLGLMAFDVIVCKLRRLPSDGLKRDGRELSLELERNRFARQAILKESFLSSKSIREIFPDLDQWHRNLKLQGQWIQKDAGFVFYGGRQKIQRWGDFILHVSIVVILIGGLIGAIFGFEESLPIAEGTSVKMKNRPYEVFVHQFEIDYYESTGSPSLYASELEVRQEGRILGKKRVVVNDPLEINGIRFYQASWGMTEQLKALTLKILGRHMVLPLDQAVEISGLPYSIVARRFLPSFEIGPQSNAVTSDYEGRNPAVLLDFVHKKNVEARVWLLKNHPEIAFSERAGVLSRTSPPPFSILGIDAVLFSGIQVGYDPGASVFWVGAIFLLFGLSLHFYTHQRRIAVVIYEKDQKTLIEVFGWNSRRPNDFRFEFNAAVSNLKRVCS